MGNRFCSAFYFLYKCRVFGFFFNFQVKFSDRIVFNDCFIHCFSPILRRCRVYISNPESVRWALGAVGGLVRAAGEVSLVLLCQKQVGRPSLSGPLHLL